MEKRADYQVYESTGSQPLHQSTRDGERITYDFRGAREQAKKETIEHFKRRSAEIGVDWKEQYEQYKERMRKRHWKNPI